MRRKLFREILLKYLLLILFTIAGLSIFLTVTLRDFFYNQTILELEETVSMLKNIFQFESPEDYPAIRKLCKTLGAETNNRITVILRDGRVIGDSRKTPSLMDNHADRPEVNKAFYGQTGVAIRYSTTLKKDMIYLAIPLKQKNDSKDGAVLRVARPEKNINLKLQSVNLSIWLGGLIILIITVLLSMLIAESVNKPVQLLKQAALEYSSGNFSVKTRVEKPDELKILSQSMNRMASQLSRRINTITAQKNKLEAILAHMVEPVILLDPDLLIREINEAAAELFDITLERFEGHSLIEVIRNTSLYDLSRTAADQREFMETAIVVEHLNVECHLQVHATPLLASQDKRCGLLLVMNDISRLVRLERMRREFVANVSHELKTPITSIKGFVEMLAECKNTEEDPEQRADFLRIIAKQTDRLDAIINDLLSLSQLEQNEEQAHLEKENCVIADVAANAVQICQAAADRKNVRFKTEGHEQLSAPLNAFLIEQAISNLLSNAVKYSPEGSEVSIFYGPGPKPGTAEIVVTDMGCGIPKEDLPHIFERFYRVDKARSRDMGGTGLGLAIVKHIMLAHQGMVKAESEPGRGSTFSLIFRN